MKNILPLKVFLVAFSTLALHGAYADDSVWLSDQINTAIKNGQTEYYIPAGEYTLDKPITIPAGTKNFAVKGAGPDKTILKTPNAQISHAFRVGTIPIIWNNWGFANKPNYDVMPAKTGDSAIKLLPGQAAIVPGYYVLWDNYNIMCAKNVWNNLNHAEVVYVTSYDPASGVARLDGPVGREYTETPKIASVDSDVCKNITVADMGFDGALPTTASNGIVGVGLSDGVLLKNLGVKNFFTEAIMVNTCRNVQIQGCSVYSAAASDPGNGYGITVYRSRFVSISNCKTEPNMRHGIILHSGTMDAQIDSCESGAGYDLHGYDERRISFNNCIGAGITIGNDAWLGGAREVSVTNSTLSAFELRPNAKLVYVANSNLGDIRMSSVANGATQYPANPPGGFADQVYFKECRISSGTSYTVFWECDTMGQLNFVNCTLENTRNDWGSVIRSSKTSGILNFVNCTIVNRTGYVPLVFSSPSPRLSIFLTNCKIYTKANAAVKLDKTFKGTMMARSNTIYSPTAKMFIDDLSKRSRSSGNAVIVR